MATWSNVTVTNKGYALQAKLLSTDKLVITRVVSGSDRVVAGQLVNQTEISNIKQNLVVESLHYDNKGNAIIKVSTTNDGLSSSYDCNQVGIYAADPDEGEILYMIAQEAVNGERIPSIAEQPYGFYTAWLFALTYSNAQNVSVTIDPSYALTQESADSRYLQLSKIGEGLEYDEDGNLNAKAQQITVDSALSSSSTNPVQNKVVNAALGNKVDKVSGKGLSTNDYTTTEKNKLAGIAAGANNYTHPAHTAQGTGFYRVQVDDKGHVIYATAVKKGDITALGIPAQDTVYTHPQAANGATAKRIIYAVKTDDYGHIIDFIEVDYEGLTYDSSSATLKNALGKAGTGTNAVILNSVSNTASGDASLAEGISTDAAGHYSHAEGIGTNANGYAAHAEGYYTTSDGEGAHSEGYYTKALGNYSHAGGYKNTAEELQMVIGRYADTSTSAKKGPSTISSTVGSLFVIGNGTAEDKVGNAFRVSASGTVYSTSGSVTTGADGAEFYPWADGNPNAEDRIGRFVTLDGEKIRFATSDDEDIEGVISDMDIASFIGDCYADHWHGKFLKDVFGRRITENVEIEAYTDENGVEHPAETVTQFKLNPEFDPKQVYISREDRAEYGLVALWGKVVVIDDGTCKVNGYCKPGKEGGIATASDTMTPYRVMERIDENHVRIRIKNCR